MQQVTYGGGNLYASVFTDTGTNQILEINPTTGATTSLFANGVIGSNTFPNFQPVGVAVGPDGLLYFTDNHDGILFSSNLDGSNPQIVATGFVGAAGIAFVSVPEPVSLGLMGLGSLALVIQAGVARRRRTRKV